MLLVYIYILYILYTHLISIHFLSSSTYLPVPCRADEANSNYVYPIPQDPIPLDLQCQGVDNSVLIYLYSHYNLLAVGVVRVGRFLLSPSFPPSLPTSHSLLPSVHSCTFFLPPSPLSLILLPSIYLKRLHFVNVSYPVQVTKVKGVIFLYHLVIFSGAFGISSVIVL